MDIPAPPRLLERVHEIIRRKHYSIRTEQAYVDWIKRFILFHDKRHPTDLGAREVEAFLTHLAVDREVSASTQNQAQSALLFTVGRFLISGRYDCANLECWWTKTYPGSHDVHYRGFREGKGIWGTWEIGLHSRGGFHIWPKGAAGGDLESRVVLESEPVEAVGRELVPSGPQKEEGGLWLYTQRLFSTKTRQFFSREKNILKLFRRSQHRPELRFNPAINFHAVQ